MTTEERRARNTERRRRWKKQNPGKDAQAARARYVKNRDKLLDRNRRWRFKNREQLCRTSREKYQKNITNNRIRAKQRRRRPEYREKMCAYLKEWRTNNKEKHRANNKRWREQNREQQIAKSKEWIRNNRSRYNTNLRKYNTMKRQTDMAFRLRHSLASRLKGLLKGKIKSGSTLQLIDATMDELKVYLESQFKDSMNWDNYGKTGWHIDHIVPCCSFDLTDPKQQELCFHWSNLQPLWWWENLAKGKKLAA